MRLGVSAVTSIKYHREVPESLKSQRKSTLHICDSAVTCIELYNLRFIIYTLDVLKLNGIFTISLDFELHWGGFEKWKLEPRDASREPATTGSGGASVGNEFFSPSRNYNEYFFNTRKAIPEMLGLFEKHEIHVTWATVGMLFHKNREELLKNAPLAAPTYREQHLSAYHYIRTQGIGIDETDDPFHFAPSLIAKIKSTPFQEIGTHTFSHYYCNEAGQTVEQFREDLRSAQRVAMQYGVTLSSLVFPRNQFNDEYLRTAFEEGIFSVRSNPLDWFWNIQSTQSESAWKRLNRGLDAYLPVGKKNTYHLSSLSPRDGLPVCLPASRLLRPYNPRELFLNAMKLSRIRSEMERAAREGEVYHLWWHPHNFGTYPHESLDALSRILKHFIYCRDRYKMESLNMAETVMRLNHGTGGYR